MSNLHPEQKYRVVQRKSIPLAMTLCWQLKAKMVGQVEFALDGDTFKT